MATGAKMSFNYYQNGKYGTLPQNPQKEQEISHDMHLKMSKKIAQLTKVIYALNTKNDEHEAALQSVKEQHEAEMHQLLAETKEKVELYRSKINTDHEHRKKIQTLEMCLAEHERHKSKAQEEVELFKRIAERRECDLKTEHSQRILDLSKDILNAKEEFERKLEQFEEWKQKVELSKAREIDEIRQKFEIEMSELRDFHRTQNSDWLNECGKIEDKYKNENENYKNQIEALQNEKLKIEEEYELKLSKSKAFYEKELEAYKSGQNANRDGELQSLKDQQEKMRKDFIFTEWDLKRQVERLINQLSESEESVEKFQKELANLKDYLNDKDCTSSALNQKLQVSVQEVSNLKSQLKDVKTELIGSQERCSAQAAEMLDQSSKLGQMEAVTMQQTNLLKQLETELGKLTDKLTWLESERKQLMSERQNLTEEQKSQLKSLEQALEDLSIDKQTLQQRMEKEVQSLKDNFSKREKALQAEHGTEMNNLKIEHCEKLDQIKTTSAQELKQTREELETKLQDETARLTSEKVAIMSEFDKVRTELFSKLHAAENEVKRLEDLVKESEHGLGSASSHLNSLKEASARMKNELDSTRAELKTTKITAANYKAELEKLQLLHESKLAEHQLEMKTRLENLAAKLDNKWTETMRSECKKIQREVTEQKDDENKAALEKLAYLKDEEISSLREKLERTVTELQNQIENLMKTILQNENTSATVTQHLSAQAEAERLQLQQEMRDAAISYASKVDALEKSHKEDIYKLKQDYENGMQTWESKMKAKHIKEMQAQVVAHRLAIENIQEQAEQIKHTQLADLAEKHKLALDLLRSKLMEQHLEELETLKKSHEAEVRSARMELERAVEISKHKDKDHHLRVEELQGEITQRERHIKNLEDDLRNQRETFDKLNQEIDVKGREIVRARTEANNMLKSREDHWRREKQNALNSLSSDHIRQSEQLVNQFNVAQMTLKDKISELQIRLEEAEEQYDNRDSRPEDLELIEQLREAIQEREMRIKEIIDEKRFYQLELVNRETNFNKVFNSSPNVGVLNPLTVNTRKKKGDKLPAKRASAPSLTSAFPMKLDPLPGSPIHDERLNPSKPLPQPFFSKKFVI